MKCSLLFIRNSSFSLIAEILTAVRFAVIGAGATIIHMTVAFLIINYVGRSPYFSNSIAFLIAFAISFIGHYYYSFRSQHDRSSALFRFFLVAAVAFLVNNIILDTILRRTLLPYDWATVLAAIVIPMITYLLNRLWAFRE